MAQHSTLVPSAIATALLSTLLLSTPAHAGLLGGGAGGGFGGGLSGGLSSATVGAGGRAGAEISRGGDPLAARDRIARKTAETTQAGDEAGRAAVSKAADTRAAAAQGVHDTRSQLQERAGDAAGAGAGASVTGSAQASPADRSLSAEASAGGSAKR